MSLEGDPKFSRHGRRDVHQGASSSYKRLGLRITFPGGPRHNPGERGRSNKSVPLKPKISSRRRQPAEELVSRVRIYNGNVFGESWIIKQCSRLDVDNFKPIMINTNDLGHVEFFLKDHEAAETIKFMSRRLVHSSNQRLNIVVNKISATWAPLSSIDTDLINRVVDSRFDIENKAIDLSEFHLDPVFVAEGAHLTLTKNNVMLAVMEHIDNKYGHITALSLKGNRLSNLDFASMLPYIAKFITVLDLSNNQINDIKVLERLRGLRIKILFFQGNPVCEQYTRATDYLTAIHQIFPRLCNLDSDDVIPLETGSGFDSEAENAQEPSQKPGFYYNDGAVQTLVEAFINDFYKLYDGLQGAQSRKELCHAYEENNSSFSLTLKNLPGADSHRYPNDANYLSMIRASHNILDEQKWSHYRSSRLFKGGMAIAVQLSKMPLTKHLMDSFIVDCHLKTEQALGFTIQGLFEEGPFIPNEKPSVNFFSRSFVVAPRSENSVTILLDQLYISSFSHSRIALHKVTVEKLNKQAVAAVLERPFAALQVQAPSDDIKQQMIERFCSESKMNKSYSTLCLEENNWNYEEAATSFMRARDAGKIPDEAYVSTSS